MEYHIVSSTYQMRTSTRLLMLEILLHILHLEQRGTALNAGFLTSSLPATTKLSCIVEFIQHLCRSMPCDTNVIRSRYVSDT